MRVIVDKTSSLQYFIELGAAGYHLAAPKTTRVTDALATFRRIQKVYRDPFPQPLHRVDLNVCGPDLNDRFWEAYQWRIYDDILVGKAPRDTTIGFLSLRPGTPDSERFRSHKFNFAINYFHVDLWQDLLVLCSLEKLHFRRLSTGEVHSKLQPRTDGSLIVSLQHVPIDRALWSMSIWRDWLLVSAQSYRAGSSIWYTHLLHWPTGSIRKVRLRMISGLLRH